MGTEYILNKVLEEAIADFQEAKRKKDDKRKSLKERQEYELVFNSKQDELADIFYLLAENIIRAFGFKLIDRDDALQEGVMICLQKLDQFKPERGKAFNYYTTCTLNHFRQLYRGAKNQVELQKRYFDHLVDCMDHMMLRKGSNGQIIGGFKSKGTDEF